jgi:hypothetical protein
LKIRPAGAKPQPIGNRDFAAQHTFNFCVYNPFNILSR